MARRFFDRRQITARAFKDGENFTEDIRSVKFLLHTLVIRVEGKMDLESSGGKLQPGGIHNILKRVKFRFGGYDPAVNQRFGDQTRIDLRGVHFGWGGNPTATINAVGSLPAPNLVPRFNLLQPHKLVQPYGDFKDPDPTYTAGPQDFFAEFIIPFNLSNGVRPRDLLLDARNADLLSLDIETCDDGNDLFTAANANPAFTETTIKVLARVLRPLDTMEARGSGHTSRGYLRAVTESIPVLQDNEDDRKRFTLSDNLLYQAIIATRPDAANNSVANVPRDDILTGIQLERYSDAFYQYTAPQMRAENVRNLSRPSVEIGGDEMATLLHNSGLYFAAPGWEDYDDRVRLGNTPYLGRGDNSADYILKYKKPSDRNGTLEIVTVEVAPDDALAAVSRPYDDLNPAQKELAAPERKEMNDMAMAQQVAADTVTL